MNFTRTGLVLVASLAIGGCSIPDTAAKGPRPLKDTLELYGVRSEVLPSGDGEIVVVPVWGARVMGVMLGGENALWTTPDLPGKDWNKGGWRTWYAPEGHEKGVFWDVGFKNWTCPPQVDNGDYRPIAPPRPGVLAYESSFQVTTNDGTPYSLRFRREIGALANPLAGDPLWDGLKGRVGFAGVAFAHALQNRSRTVIDREIGLWSLVQVRGRGTAIIPVTEGDGSVKKVYRDYYEPIPEDRRALQGGAFTFFLDGSRRYKVGVPADRTGGLVGWLTKFPSGAGLLLVQRFAVDPAAKYIDRPKDAPATNGDPFQCYNHLSGGPEGFSELECHAPSVRLEPDGEQVFPVELFVYRGDAEDLKKVASKLLGVDVGKVKIF